MPDWSLTQLEHFVAVAESPSLSQAARRIHLSQPALTKSVRRLEEELGNALFDRAGTLELTPLGRAFLPRARALIAQARELDRDVALLAGAELGELKVGCGPTVADTFAGEALAEVLVARPELRITLVVAEFRTLVAPLRDREFDLLIAEVSEFAAQPDLVIEPLPSQEIVLFCRAGHPLAGKPDVTPEEFFSYPLVSTGLPEWARQWLESNCPRPRGSADRMLSLRCSHHVVIDAVVAGSDAISGAPWPIIADGVERSRLAVVHLPVPPMRWQAGIIRLRDRTLSPGGRLLVEALRRTAVSHGGPGSARVADVP